MAASECKGMELPGPAHGSMHVLSRCGLVLMSMARKQCGVDPPALTAQPSWLCSQAVGALGEVHTCTTSMYLLLLGARVPGEAGWDSLCCWPQASRTGSRYPGKEQNGTGCIWPGKHRGHLATPCGITPPPEPLAAHSAPGQLCCCCWHRR